MYIDEYKKKLAHAEATRIISEIMQEGMVFTYQHLLMEIAPDWVSEISELFGEGDTIFKKVDVYILEFRKRLQVYQREHPEKMHVKEAKKIPEYVEDMIYRCWQEMNVERVAKRNKPRGRRSRLAEVIHLPTKEDT